MKFRIFDSWNYKRDAREAKAIALTLEIADDTIMSFCLYYYFPLRERKLAAQALNIAIACT